MRFRAQTADLQRPQPFWLRAITLACVLFLGSISTAQAAHLHGQWLPHQAPEISKHVTGLPATTEDACPLCVAMHSALPAQTIAVSVDELLVPLQTPAPVPPPVASVWRFELFSRPPPAFLS